MSFVFCDPKSVLLITIVVIAIQHTFYVTYYSVREQSRFNFTPWLCDSFPKRLSRKSVIDVIVHDSVFTPSKNRCFQAFQKDNSTEHFSFCYPSVMVMGFPKCGTSYLFKTLSTHPQIIATKRKELCIGGVKSETWWDFFTRLPTPEEVSTKLVMSGCLHVGANKEAADNLCVRNTKYIFLVRDVADMLWAAYNYWCLSTIDRDCIPGGRTVATSQRSPEHFHLLISSNATLGGGLPLDPHSGICFRNALEEAVRAFGKFNVHVLKSEDMNKGSTEYKRNSSFSRLLDFLDLAISTPHQLHWLNQVVAHPIEVNAGHSLSSRGEFVVAEAAQPVPRRSSSGSASGGGGEGEGESDSGLYEVSGFRPMLPTTRTLIHRRWKTECEWLHSQWGLFYEACA